MSGKSTKLIIGIILFLLAIYLYVFGGFKFVLALILGIIGIALIILSFTGREEMDISEIEKEPKDVNETPEPSVSGDLSDLKPESSQPEPKADVPEMGEEEKRE